MLNVEKENLFDNFFINQEKDINIHIKKICDYVLYNIDTNRDKKNIRRIIIKKIADYINIYDSNITSNELNKIMLYLKTVYNYE